VLSTYSSVSQSQSSGELRVDFYIKTADAKAKLVALEARKEELQTAITAGGGEQLVWYSKEDVQACVLVASGEHAEPLRQVAENAHVPAAAVPVALTHARTALFRE
jgi:hypothetical protein